MERINFANGKGPKAQRMHIGIIRQVRVIAVIDRCVLDCKNNIYIDSK